MLNNLTRRGSFQTSVLADVSILDQDMSPASWIDNGPAERRSVTKVHGYNEEFSPVKSIREPWLWT